MLSLSPSALSTYYHCPRKYAFQYVEKKKPPEKIFRPELEIGRLIHETLGFFFTSLPRQDRRKENLFAIAYEKFSSLKLQLKEASSFWKEKVERMLSFFFEIEDAHKEPLQWEKNYRAPFLEDTDLWGRIDRLDQEEGTFYITDYKTGKIPPPYSLDFQSPVYIYLVQAVTKQPVDTIRYVYLAEKRIIKKKIQLNKEMKKIYEVTLALKKDVFLAPRPSSLCSFCDYLSFCPEGKKFQEKCS